jgi:ankyrin repeat protein
LNWEKVDVARMLIERGADVTAQDDDGWTPLHYLSFLGQEVDARMLIECGADLTAQDENGQTPLHFASVPSSPYWTSPQRYAEVANMLLENGADVNARNKNGLTPFVLASKHGLAEVILVLVQHGADSGAHDNTN